MGCIVIYCYTGFTCNNNNNNNDDDDDGDDNNKNKSLYLRVSVFSTVVLIGDIVNKEANIVNKQKLVENPNWKEADQLAV